MYVWQTDIRQALDRRPDEPLKQIRDTIEVRTETFSIPLAWQVAAKINVLSPAKDASDFDHTIGEACVMPGEEVHMTLDDNYVKNEGSLLNRQMGEVYTYYMQSLARYLEAYGSGDRQEVARLANAFNQWVADWIRTHPEAPGAPYALYQFSKPELAVAYSELLKGDALTSLFYPYAERFIKQSKGILQRRAAQAAMNRETAEAPDFSLHDTVGASVSLADFRGKWVILDFWGSWCTPCIKGFPELKAIYAAYAGRVEIIGIACNDTEEGWKKAVARFELPWINLYQPKGTQVSAQYHVTAFPTKVVIDPQGMIRKVYSGASPTFRQELESWLQ